MTPDNDVELINPFSGEVLDENDVEELVRVEAALDKYLRGFGVLYGIRGDLRLRIAQLQGPIRAPRPRDRSETQDRAVKCPRCGHRHD